MELTMRSVFRRAILGLTCVMVMGLTVVMTGQEALGQSSVVIDDWTHHHLIFSNPGTFADAMKTGSFVSWYRIVTDPRYAMQQMRQKAAAVHSSAQEGSGTTEMFAAVKDPPKFKGKNTLHRDWSIGLGSAGVAPDMYPTKYTFNPVGTPTCSDFVVYGINAPGSNTAPKQTNIVGLNNLYNGTCTTGNVPNVLFSYYVGTGTVKTSPVLSSEGTKVAYVESVSGGSKFHVTTIGTGGTIASPVAPATDTAITMSGGVSVTRSTPFYDYGHDAAYVGDDSGKLHKFSPVFNGTVAEVTTNWPVQLHHSSTNAGTLTGPVYDIVSGNVYVGDSAGYLYSVSGGTSPGTPVASAQLGAGAGIVDAPLVDSTAKTVYVFLGDNAGGTESAVVQLSIATGNISSGTTGTAAAVGAESTTIPVYDGSFDSTYYSSANGTAGHLYVCGNAGGYPTLYPIPITSTGAMGTVGTGVVLASSNIACSPLTEFYNTNTSKDWLFAAVPGSSCGASSSTAGGCVMSFNITSIAPTIGPWTPSTAFASNAEIVDTSGRLQECTGGGCGVAGSLSGTTPPSFGTSTATDGGLAANPSVGSVSLSGEKICFTNTSGSAITLSASGNNNSSTLIRCNASSCSSSGNTQSCTLNSGAIGLIDTAESGSTSIGQTTTIGPIQYQWVSSYTSAATQTSPQVYENCSSCHDQTAQNLEAAIIGSTSTCNFTLGGICYDPGPLTWAFQGTSNGQTTAPQATGASAMIIDNAGTSAGEANIYFGTLAGTGTTNSAVKLSQAGLQ